MTPSRTADAIWYPTQTPANFTATDLGREVRVKAGVMHTNADATTSDVAGDWYAPHLPPGMSARTVFDRKSPACRTGPRRS